MAKNDLQIKIGNKSDPFIIAELSANHKKSIKRIYKMIDKAKEANVSAIKIQSYKPETMTLKIKNKNFFISDKKAYGKIIIILICIKKVQRHGNGQVKSLNMLTKKN